MAIDHALPVPSRLGLGLRAGATAGWVLLLLECAIGTARGSSPLGPPRLAASAALGAGALSPLFPALGPLVLGSCLYLVVGSLLGGLFVVVLGSRRRSTAALLALGAAYGTALWLVVGVTVGPLLLPQLAVPDLLWQGALAHAFGFGVVLAALVASEWPR
jgi:hypothetical protein